MEKLVGELDGEVHFNTINEKYDIERTQYLNSLGIKVIRFENKDIFENLEIVLTRIEENFKEPPPLTPPHKGGDQESLQNNYVK